MKTKSNGIDNDDDLFEVLANISKMDSLANFNSNVNCTLFDVDSLLEEDGFSGQKRKAASTSYGAKASSSRTSLCSASNKNNALSWLKKSQSKKKPIDKSEKKTLQKPTIQPEKKSTLSKSLGLESIDEYINPIEINESKQTPPPNNLEPPSNVVENKDSNSSFKSVIDDIFGEMDEITNKSLPRQDTTDTSTYNDTIDSFDTEIQQKEDSDETYDQLDDELDDINESLDNLDLDDDIDEITLPDKLICRACNEPIVSGPACRMTKGTYHVDHFVCVECNGSLLNKPFYERLDKLYCVNDYIKNFAHVCAVCKEPVLNDIILSLGLYYHLDHFKCRICDGVIGDEPYHLVNKIQHCVSCFQKLYSKTCEKCGDAINSNHVSVQGKFWHFKCFVCSVCSTTLENGAFQFYQNKLLCISDYHRMQGTICHSCNQPIIGKCVQSKDRFYHVDHFVCSQCKIPLMSKSYKIFKDREYCTTCFDHTTLDD